jgi:hypothetical protein
MPPGKKNIPNGQAVAIREKLAAALDSTATDTRPGNRAMRQLRDLQQAVADSIQDLDDATT